MLPKVVIPIVMNFTQQNDRFVGETCKQQTGRDLSATGGIQPLRWMQVALRRAIIGRSCAKATHHEANANYKKSAEESQKRNLQTISTPGVENNEAFCIKPQTSDLQTTLAGSDQHPLKG
jgi:hypothetical protein